MLSHSSTPPSLTDRKTAIATRITQQGDKPYATVTQQLALLDQLSEFAFGQFLLVNQGINGFWTHYMLTHPWHGRKTGKNHQGEPLHPLERFILDRCPVLLATQERFDIFLRENQTQVSHGATLACIACGMMNDLLYLDYTGITDIQLIGLDYDANTLKDAEKLAQEKALAPFVTLMQQDAWQLNAHDEYDLISCNGLTIYEPDDARVASLYQRFFTALKPGGKLVTSFLTFPPTLTDACEWDMTHVNRDDLLQQKILLADIVEAKFQHYRSSQLTQNQLAAAGFSNIKLIYDKAKMFPTVVAYKE